MGQQCSHPASAASCSSSLTATKTWPAAALGTWHSGNNNPSWGACSSPKPCTSPGEQQLCDPTEHSPFSHCASPAPAPQPSPSLAVLTALLVPQSGGSPWIRPRGTEGAQPFPYVRIPASSLGIVSKSFSPAVFGKPFMSCSWPLSPP